jgi:hypothetical protein
MADLSFMDRVRYRDTAQATSQALNNLNPLIHSFLQENSLFGNCLRNTTEKANAYKNYLKLVKAWGVISNKQAEQAYREKKQQINMELAQLGQQISSITRNKKGAEKQLKDSLLAFKYKLAKLRVEYGTAKLAPVNAGTMAPAYYQDNVSKGIPAKPILAVLQLEAMIENLDYDKNKTLSDQQKLLKQIDEQANQVAALCEAERSKLATVTKEIGPVSLQETKEIQRIIGSMNNQLTCLKGAITQLETQAAVLENYVPLEQYKNEFEGLRRELDAIRKAISQ